MKLVIKDYFVLVIALVSMCIICNIVMLRSRYSGRRFRKLYQNTTHSTTTTTTVTRNSTTNATTTTTIAATSKVNMTKASYFKQAKLANINLMKLLPERRPRFNYTMTPWRVSPDKPNILTDKEIEWTMLVVIKSHYNRSDRRDVIRETWGSYLFLNGVRLEVVFIIAAPTNSSEIMELDKENEKHGDLLQVNQTELYEEIGRKAIAAMQWVSDNFPSHWIYCSCDDDVLPDLKKMRGEINYLMLKALKTVDPKSNHTDITAMERIPILCELLYRPGSKVFRSGPWIVTKEDNPNALWPPFCLGGFYSMSVNLARAIYSVSRNYIYFHLDDVWITALLRLKVCDELNEEAFGVDRADKFCLISQKDSVRFKHLPKLSSDEFRKKWKEHEKNFEKDDVVRRIRDHVKEATLGTSIARSD